MSATCECLEASSACVDYDGQALAAFLDMLKGKNAELKSVAATAMQWMSEDQTTRRSVYTAHQIATKGKQNVQQEKVAGIQAMKDAMQQARIR